MLNERFIATVKPYNGTEANPASPDVKGFMPVVLVPFAGKCPSKRIIAGTLANNEGLIINESYLFTVTEQEPDDTYGRQFNFNANLKVGFTEMMSSTQYLGQPTIIEVRSAEELAAKGITENETPAETPTPAENTFEA